MLWAELVPLTAALAHEGRHITIETAGTLDLAVKCDLMSISPKLSNSTPSRERHPRLERPARGDAARACSGAPPDLRLRVSIEVCDRPP